MSTPQGSNRKAQFAFELSDDLPAPLSVAQRNGLIVLILRRGQIVDAALVRALNDLTQPAEDET